MPHFYATAGDLIPVLEAVERKHKLAYTLCGSFETPALVTVHSGSVIATLRSPSPNPNAVNGYTYLVTPADVPVAVHKISLNKGGVRYAVDQLHNPISIAFTHGGLYRPDILLYGRVDTASNHPLARKLCRAFAYAIKKRFAHVRAFFVGPQAVELLHRGCRLTIGANSPREYDLADEPPTAAA